jgi:lysylphosphatidylglycerol synthetase-like protein (DUF2156 family)
VVSTAGSAEPKESVLHVLVTIALSAIAVVVIGWLAVSFLNPGVQRRRIEWIAATALYVTLLAFFLNLLRRSIADDSTVGMVAFGFLAFMFACGLSVSSVRMIRALAGGSRDAKASATH